MSSSDDGGLGARLDEILNQGGGGEAIGDLRFLPLCTLESGARYGVDALGRWILVPADERPPSVISAENAHLYHEALETKRRTFEDILADAAREHALPVDPLVFSFPATTVVRAMLEKRSSYLTRLALEWLLPSELRELRTEILAVTTDDRMPKPVRDFATRLVVPA